MDKNPQPALNPQSLNKVIHERVRLGIVSALAARGALTFTELKELLSLTDGNLSVHSALLEKHGLITVTKEFVGRKPQTTFELTAEGRSQLNDYLDELERLLKALR